MNERRGRTGGGRRAVAEAARGSDSCGRRLSADDQLRWRLRQSGCNDQEQRGRDQRAWRRAARRMALSCAAGGEIHCSEIGSVCFGHGPDASIIWKSMDSEKGCDSVSGVDEPRLQRQSSGRRAERRAGARSPAPSSSLITHHADTRTSVSLASASSSHSAPLLSCGSNRAIDQSD